MKSAIAILTYRRHYALRETLDGIRKHCPHYPLAVFEDLGQRDGTEDWLSPVGTTRLWRPHLEAEQVRMPDELQGRDGNWQVFLGTRNLGVSGNSNRAIKWFMEETGCDHLCLLNDDLHVLGDFVSLYGRGHADLGIGFFCFCDFTRSDYQWVTVRQRGYGVKLLPRLTGIMCSMTRQVIDKIGYFDMRFGKWGQEHCDYTYRARFVGEVSLDGQPQNGIDLEHGLLKHQEVETSMPGVEGQRAQEIAAAVMAEVAKGYRTGTAPFYVPYRLALPNTAGGHRNNGIPVQNLLAMGYNLVTDMVDSRAPNAA